MVDETNLSSANEVARADVIRISGSMMAAIERALIGTGIDFVAALRMVRLQLADDYPFLDPVALNASGNQFEYANNQATISGEVSIDTYVAGLSEALRRVVNQAAVGDNARRVRERVGLELAMLARKDRTLTRSGFGPQLDRIAGTKVI